MTLENVETGIHWEGGSLDLERCVLRGFHNDFTGLFLAFGTGSLRECEFEYSGLGTGCDLYKIFQGVDIQDCIFRGFGYGVRSFNGSKNVTISGCEFDGAYIGILYQAEATGSISNCTLRNTLTYALIVSDYSDVDVDLVFIDGAETGIAVAGTAILSGRDVVIENTTGAGLLTWAQGMVTLNNSHILPATGWGVRSFGYTNSHVVLDLTGNYWGVADSDSIAAMIEDGVDDPSVLCIVNYEPFAGAPVPTESTSWGSVKAMFR